MTHLTDIVGIRKPVNQNVALHTCDASLVQVSDQDGVLTGARSVVAQTNGCQWYEDEVESVLKSNNVWLALTEEFGSTAQALVCSSLKGYFGF